jgi:dipeptidyl aminopeptidase/acylaminoacyl peptidase
MVATVPVSCTETQGRSDQRARTLAPMPASSPITPTISAEMVAGGRTVGEPRLSPDGLRVMFVAAWGASTALVVVPVGGGPERIVTTSPAPPRPRPFGGGSFSWLPDGSAVVYASADGNLWRQPAVGGAATRLTDQAGDAAASNPAVAPDGSRIAFVYGEQHVGVVPIDGSAAVVRVSSGVNDFACDPSWSADSACIAWHEWDVPHMAWDQSRWVVAPDDGSGPVAAMEHDMVQVQQPRFAPVGSDLAYLSDKTGWLNLWAFGAGRNNDAPLVSELFEHGDPTWGGGQSSFTWSPDATMLAFNRNENGWGRLCVVELATGLVHEIARAHHGGLDWRGDTLVAVRSGGVTPHQIVAYDMRSLVSPVARTVLAVGPVAGFEAANLPEPELVTHLAQDGTTLHARLYRPRVEHPDRPLLCWIHGGPTDQWSIRFMPRVAYFIDRGWTVLVPDHRGSTGHGRVYTQSMRGRWGDLDVSDVADSIRAAIALDWCDPDRIAVMGGSAGGFTALNVLAFHGARCAAGVALYPVTDLIGLTEATHRFEAHYTDSLVGRLPDATETYERRSVLGVAGQITTPTLVLHGSADDVVPVAQSQELVARCSAVELHIYDGEGHGWRRPETTLDELARVTAFLERHLEVS